MKELLKNTKLTINLGIIGSIAMIPVIPFTAISLLCYFLVLTYRNKKSSKVKKFDDILLRVIEIILVIVPMYESIFLIINISSRFIYVVASLYAVILMIGWAYMFMAVKRVKYLTWSFASMKYQKKCYKFGFNNFIFIVYIIFTICIIFVSKEFPISILALGYIPIIPYFLNYRRLSKNVMLDKIDKLEKIENEEDMTSNKKKACMYVIAFIVIILLIYNAINISKSTISLNTCLADNCSEEREEGSYYCSKHICKVLDCTNGVEKDSKYCSIHKCYVDGCNNIRVTKIDSMYCFTHKCKIEECKNQKEKGSDYCYSHKRGL